MTVEQVRGLTIKQGTWKLLPDSLCVSGCHCQRPNTWIGLSSMRAMPIDSPDVFNTVT
jgi:hypothetical protein